MKSLYEKLAAYIQQDKYPFHMPGHKGNPAFLPPISLIKLDVTELDETDNLHAPTNCIQETERRIASLYGADKSFLLVNGSTSGIVAAISAVCQDGDTLAVARNCHRSVFSGMVLSGARPIYFLPEVEGVSKETVSDVLARNPKAKAVIITSPTYEGVVSDIEAIAHTVHSRGCVLIVDEAHGAHFPFHPAFPKGALMQGADIVVHSFHKTLPAFSQSAAIHVKGNRVDTQRLQQCLACVQTSSPSYLMMATTDYMLNILQENPAYFERYVENLLALRTALKAYLLELPNADISKLVMTIPNGYELSKAHNLAFEMITDHYTLAMTSVADTPEGFAALKAAMKEAKVIEPWKQSFQGLALPETVFSPREAMKKRTRKAKLADSIGEVSGGFLMPYPPGIPLLAPGERITESVLAITPIDCEIEILLL